MILNDFLLGVMTESLLNDNQPLETGFAAALTVEPLLGVLGHHRIFPSGWNGVWAKELEDGPQGDPNWFEHTGKYIPRG